ncbi:14266_t:CDS:2 [Entrophospora sp. SA101]|nr:191_t:CDS:2 [Entrophospora sp. SA101]CAJ0754252.1 14266_t:CDS:2 [Entrophospora sp. SA101]CAJ0830449.1 7604_t:CDS:2 [Entrophospora sp. SA101]CAJ0836789.1 11367_t:CDS:2 [Entrophospora sp. SA101]
MIKSSKYYPLMHLLLIYLIVNSLLINANELNYLSKPLEVERDNPRVKNIIVGSFIGGLSHLAPLLEISKILVERGYNVTLISPENNHYTKYEKIKHYSTGPKFDFKDIAGWKKIMYEDPPSIMSFFPSYFEHAYSLYLNSYYVYERVFNELKPDLFLCDLIQNEVCLDVAWKLKKPAVNLGSSLSINLENESFLERLRCFVIPKFEVVWTTRSAISHLNELRAKLGISPTSHPYARIKNKLFLADTFFGFDLPTPLSPVYTEIGPILSDNYPPLTPEVKTFLDNHPRTMFISLGTFVYTTKKNIGILLQSFIEATENGVIDGVIWGLATVGVEEIPETITLSNGKELNTMYIINNQHPNIQILSFAPQFSILAHENCKLFLSHAGAGSSHEAMYNGKPMLVMPIALDQHGNAERLENMAGVSLTLSKTKLNVKEILIKIRRLLSEEKFKINSERMKSLTRINSKRKHRAADLIEHVIKSNELKEKLITQEWDLSKEII